MLHKRPEAACTQFWHCYALFMGCVLAAVTSESDTDSFGIAASETSKMPKHPPSNAGSFRPVIIDTASGKRLRLRSQ